MLRLSGVSELALLRWHPESIPAMPIALPPWANTSCGVEDSVSYSYLVNKNPHQIVIVTDGDARWSNVYIGMSLFNSPCENYHLSGAKIDNNSRPAMGH